MDAFIGNLVGDVPTVTKVWTLGCLLLSILITADIVDYTKVMYNYDLVFKKGQYERLLFSLFDAGRFDITSLVNLFISTRNLSMLESSINNLSKYLWMLVMMLTMVLALSGVAQPVYSLASLLHENLLYYQLRKNPEGLNFQILAGINISPLVVPLYMNLMLYFVNNKSLLQVAMTFAPGHLVFYFDDIFPRIYKVDICKSPYDWWKERQVHQHNDSNGPSEEAAHLLDDNNEDTNAQEINNHEHHE